MTLVMALVLLLALVLIAMMMSLGGNEGAGVLAGPPKASRTRKQWRAIQGDRLS